VTQSSHDTASWRVITEHNADDLDFPDLTPRRPGYPVRRARKAGAKPLEHVLRATTSRADRRRDVTAGYMGLVEKQRCRFSIDNVRHQGSHVGQSCARSGHRILRGKTQ
jgi:hypothetical protein